MISMRYAKLTVALLTLALVPTLLAARPGAAVVETPPVGDVLPHVLADRSSVVTDRRASSVQRVFASDDWVERRYSAPGQRDVTLLVARTYDMKRVYHHPELAVVRGVEFPRARLVELPSPAGGSPLDVHVLEAERQGLAAYALLYRGETVARPFLFQVLVAPDLLLRGRRPMTLVFALDRQHVPGLTSVEESPLMRVLAEAVAGLQGPPTDSTGGE